VASGSLAGVLAGCAIAWPPRPRLVLFCTALGALAGCPTYLFQVGWLCECEGRKHHVSRILSLTSQPRRGSVAVWTLGLKDCDLTECTRRQQGCRFGTRPMTSKAGGGADGWMRRMHASCQAKGFLQLRTQKSEREQRAGGTGDTVQGKSHKEQATPSGAVE
jgi:hypothetical protein